MKKPKSMFTRRQREFMVWFTLEVMKNNAAGVHVEYEIEDVMTEFKLSKEKVVAAILFLNYTANVTLTA